MLAIRSSEEESTEMEEMDTSDPKWCWFYLAECGVWHMFEVVHGASQRSPSTVTNDGFDPSLCVLSALSHTGFSLL